MTARAESLLGLREDDRFNPSSKSSLPGKVSLNSSSFFCRRVSTELLPAGETATAVLGIDFCDSTQAANFQLW